ncbi:MAG: lysozyme inhibitor LprI family protein [Acidithiobacillus sp.]
MSVNTLSRYSTLLILSTGLWASPALAQTGLPAAQCSRAATPTEGALCANPQLRALDAELAEAYHHALATTAKGSTGRQELIAEQRAWLQERDVCKADASCLEEEYRSRIQTLKEE